MSSQVKFSLLNAERNTTETLLVHWVWSLWNLLSRLSDCQALRFRRGSPESWSPFSLPWPFWSPSHRFPTILTCKKKKKLSEDKAPVWKPLHFITTGDIVTVLILITALSVFFSRKSYKQEDKFGLYFFPYLTSSTPLNCQGEWVTWA